MKKHLISIIVPIYNAGSYLIPLIESLQNQTYENIEIILVDDGSTDGSSSIIDKYTESDFRIKAIHKQNEGQSSARNEGLKLATGDIIAFADHDDIIHPDMYHIMIEAMLNSNCSVCACSFKNIQQNDIDHITFESILDYNYTVYGFDEWICDFFKPTWRTPIWNKIYKKELIKDIRFGKDFHLGEDNLFSYQVMKKSQKITMLPNILYYQRMHGDNFEFTGTKYLTELLVAKSLILNDIKLYFPKHYNSLREQFLYECIRILNIYVSDTNNTYIFQKKQVIAILRNNMNGVFFSKIPIGRKFKLFYLQYRQPDRITSPIII